MTTTATNLIAGPLLGWFTLLALFVVGYLAHLEYLERRKNRRLEAKRKAIAKGAPLTARTPRPLAMRNTVEVTSLRPNCPILGRTFPKFDRQGTFDLRPFDLN